ncbi:MAG: redoxin domain-containing protein, partial [Campylobacter sp.]|uniref:redoxin domain-containing protein n=1 Tax=Campylobacter sp. TaxID=205 RepID=UPI003608B3AA
MLVTKKAPDFTAAAVLGNNQIVNDFNLYKNIGEKGAVVFFYPMDFTFVCPSEIIAFDKRYDEFKARGIEVIGVSAPGTLSKEMVKSMAEKPIIFACANPIPEIFPEDAKEAGAAVVSTGRSDFPNQINNVLCFPGIFRGALDVRVKDINDEMKVAAA